MRRKAVGLLVLAAAAAILLVGILRDQADPGCTRGAYGNYCGLQAFGHAFWWLVGGAALAVVGLVFVLAPARQTFK